MTGERRRALIADIEGVADGLERASGDDLAAIRTRLRAGVAALSAAVRLDPARPAGMTSTPCSAARRRFPSPLWGSCPADGKWRGPRSSPTTNLPPARMTPRSIAPRSRPRASLPIISCARPPHYPTRRCTQARASWRYRKSNSSAVVPNIGIGQAGRSAHLTRASRRLRALTGPHLACSACTKGGELVGSRRRRRGILALELLFQFGGCQRRDARPAQRVEDVRRRARGRHQPVPVVGIDGCVAELGGRRNVGQCRNPAPTTSPPAP